MKQIRKKISSDDQATVIAKIITFKELHDKIADLDDKLKDMMEQKDMLLLDLSMARADEDMLMANLEMSYGPGQLDVRTMEWVEKETKKTEDHEYIERI